MKVKSGPIHFCTCNNYFLAHTNNLIKSHLVAKFINGIFNVLPSLFTRFSFFLLQSLRYVNVWFQLKPLTLLPVNLMQGISAKIDDASHTPIRFIYRSENLTEGKTPNQSCFIKGHARKATRPLHRNTAKNVCSR